MNIVTLTLSPAFDIHCKAESFSVNRENIASITDRDAGGKGVNISRALRIFGKDSVAIVAVGEENADSFIASLVKDGIDYRAIKFPGRIRENITVHTLDGGETRLSFRDDNSPADLLARVQKTVEELCDSDTVLTITGRIPEEIPIGDIKSFIEILRIKGVRVIIDSRSFTLYDLIESKPFLIKPNEEEISAYMGREVKTFADATLVAEELHGQGIENVMISLGAKGAVIASNEGTFSVAAHEIAPISTIGAGDSSIAGFIAAMMEGKSAAECLEYAVAFGSAACLTSGTKPPRRDDILIFLKKR